MLLTCCAKSNSADTITSNAVLEAEHAQLQTQINTLKAQRKPVPEDLVDRENEYRMRMEFLVTLVSVGQLTMSGMQWLVILV